MLSELVKAVLLLVVSFLLRLVFAYLGIEIDEVVFNTIVAGIVAWLLALLGYGLTIKALPGLVRRGLLKE